MTEIDWTKPIRQKNGRAARFLVKRPEGGDRPYLVDIENAGGQWFVEFYSEEGETIVRHRALENAPERTVLYENVYNGGMPKQEHLTLEDAKINALSNSIGIIKITVEDDKLVSVEIVDG